MLSQVSSLKSQVQLPCCFPVSLSECSNMREIVRNAITTLTNRKAIRKFYQLYETYYIFSLFWFFFHRGERK